jgi:ATP-binding cassette subfamily B multidrug efflux pump
MKNLKILLNYAKKYSFRYFIGIVCLIAIDLLQLVPPKLIGTLTDLLAKGTATREDILGCILLVILTSVFISLGRFLWRIYIVGSARRVEYDIRNIMFEHFQRLSINFYNKNKTGDLMALCTNDLNAVRMTLGNGVVMIADALVMTAATIGIMLSINVKLTLLALIPLPFLAIIGTKFGKSIHHRFMKVQEAFSSLTDLVQENFSGIRVVKSFVQEEKEYERFTKENQNNFDTNMYLTKMWGLFFPLIELIASFATVILIGVGGTYVIYNYISLGDFIMFNMYLGNLVWPMMAIGWVINIIQRGFASLDRIQNILEQEPDIYDNNVKNLTSISGDIEIKNLTFTYPGSNNPALENINISLKKGQSLGIIGKTGSGKSTLVNLLVRLYNAPENTIFFHNNSINEIPLSTLRSNIGFVPQDAFLFSTTLSENINLPKDNLDMDEIIQSAKAADIYDNIMDFSDQFDTMVGERGVTLSGGQKQRLSIARALLKAPEVLIFDDCLSAVDAKTEVKILENLKDSITGRTSIIISHRISAIKDADNIIVLEDGKILENGTHQALLEKQGLYYGIYEKQLIEQKLQEEEVLS